MKASEYIIHMIESSTLEQMSTVYEVYMEECRRLDDLDARYVNGLKVEHPNLNTHYTSLIDACHRLQCLIVARYGFRNGLLYIIENIEAENAKQPLPTAS
jgi:hypothetical protein